MGKCRGVDDARVPPLAKFLHVLCSTQAGGRASSLRKKFWAKHILLSSFRTNYCPRHCAEAKSLIFVLEVFAAFLAIHCPKCSPVQFSPYSSLLAFNAENCDKTKIQHFTDFSLKKTFFRKYFQFEIFQTLVSILARKFKSKFRLG